MRLVKLLVVRDERLSIPTTVGSWEVPILQYIHGAEKIEIRGETTDRRGYPDPEVEFDRLTRRYGEDIKQEKPYVSLVYGQPPIGVRELARAIDAEAAQDAQPAKLQATGTDPLA